MPTQMPSNYYNDFDALKGYKKLLYRAGLGLQSRELNVQQDTSMHELSTVVDALTGGDGSLLKGGRCIMSGFEAQLAEAVVFARGYTLFVQQAVKTIPSVGSFTVGVAVTEEVITENEDPSLRDPAIGTRNYNEPGAARLKLTARWVLNTEVGPNDYYYATYSFQDGTLQGATVNPNENLGGAYDVIARYDYASNGNFVVEGMNVTYVYDDNMEQQHVLSIKEGLAHVNGYEVLFPYARSCRVDFGLDKQFVNAEPHTFSTGITSYPAFNNPIAEVTEAIGVKEVTQSIIHGNYSGCSDLLPNTPVVSIQSVSQGGTTYQAGVDYLLNGNYIDWSPLGAEPAPGSTYSITYRYVADITSSITISSDRKNFEISGLVNGSIFYVDYRFYIYRVDRIVLKRDGGIEILKGTPSARDPVAPPLGDGLSLALVKVAYGTNPQVENDFFRAYKMSDIKHMNDVLTDLRFDVAHLNLKDNARSQDPTMTILDTFTDPFYDDDMRDMGQTQNAVIMGEMLYPAVDWNHNIHSLSTDLTLPFTDQISIEQKLVTKSRKINAFAWSAPGPAIIDCTPKNYWWVAYTIQTWAVGLMDWGYYSDVDSAVPQISILVSGGPFNANENVTVWVDGQNCGTYQAGPTGQLSAYITTPAGLRTGTKLIEAVGNVSGAKGQVYFTARASVYVWVRTFWPFGGGDPLAQTFTPSEDMFLSSAAVRFHVLPTQWCEVNIMETTAGMPDKNKIVAIKRLQRSEITLLGSGQKFTFDSPVFLQKDVEYALCAITTDAVAELGVAEMGKYDGTNFVWVTSQPYSIGVLLQSSNQSTWSPIQTEDLTFAVYRAKFGTSYTQALHTFSVTDCTDLLLACSSKVYPGTSLEFRAILLDRGNETYNINPGSPLIIEKYTGQVQITATLTSSNDKFSPTMQRDFTLMAGSVDFPSTYIGRSFDVSGTNLTLYLDILENGPSSVKAYFYNTGGVWTELTRGTGLPVGDGWVRMSYSASGLSISSTKIKLVLDTPDLTLRPYARKLRAVVS